MRYSYKKIAPCFVRVGNVIISGFNNDTIKIEKIVQKNGGYDFYYNIVNFDHYLYEMLHVPDHGIITIRIDNLTEILKKL